MGKTQGANEVPNAMSSVDAASWPLGTPQGPQSKWLRLHSYVPCHCSFEHLMMQSSGRSMV